MLWVFQVKRGQGGQQRRACCASTLLQDCAGFVCFKDLLCSRRASLVALLWLGRSVHRHKLAPWNVSCLLHRYEL